MIDLRENESLIASYCKKYRHLYPPLSPGLRMRMEQITPEQAKALEKEEVDYSALLKENMGDVHWAACTYIE